MRRERGHGAEDDRDGEDDGRQFGLGRKERAIARQTRASDHEGVRLPDPWRTRACPSILADRCTAGTPDQPDVHEPTIREHCPLSASSRSRPATTNGSSSEAVRAWPWLMAAANARSWADGSLTDPGPRSVSVSVDPDLGSRAISVLPCGPQRTSAVARSTAVVRNPSRMRSVVPSSHAPVLSTPSMAYATALTT